MIKDWNETHGKRINGSNVSNLELSFPKNLVCSSGETAEERRSSKSSFNEVETPSSLLLHNLLIEHQ